MGKLFVIDGVDSSGKTTQWKRLASRLAETGYEVRAVSFPDYASPSSALVRMYLDGRFGEEPADVNAYAASSFYAVDRYASYMIGWRAFYEAGGTVLAARYTTSNAIHQAAKLPSSEREAYLEWLFDYEYRLLGLPAPDGVFYLDMPHALALALLRERSGDGGDIHEHDAAFLETCGDMGRVLAARYGWTVIPCAKQEKLRSVEDIGEELYRKILLRLKEESS